MGFRLDLQSRLEAILGSDNVYFQPPSSGIMKYPCIVYDLNKFDDFYANNKLYYNEKRYQVTLIDENPDNSFVDVIKELPKCSFDRHFISDNLHHYVFNLYF